MRQILSVFIILGLVIQTLPVQAESIKTIAEEFAENINQISLKISKAQQAVDTNIYHINLIKKVIEKRAKNEATEKSLTDYVPKTSKEFLQLISKVSIAVGLITIARVIITQKLVHLAIPLYASSVALGTSLGAEFIHEDPSYSERIWGLSNEQLLRELKINTMELEFNMANLDRLKNEYNQLALNYLNLLQK